MKLNRFDRLTLALFPNWTINRIRARAAIEGAKRHYDAADQGRRTQHWVSSYGDADQSARGAIHTLRVHARELLRNNSWARRGQRVIANNTVGTGIVPKAPNAKLQALWKRWAETTECESEGRHTFYSMQNLAMKTIAESGEILFRRRARRPSDGLTVPLQIQILEPDYLDTGKNFQTSAAGGPIIQGVEFDLLGRRAAYWLFAEHPGSGRNSSASHRVPASEVIHCFYSERPGQTRGVSWFAPTLITFKDFDEYEDATLMRQKIASCLAAFVTDGDGTAMPLGGPDEVNANPLVDTFEPGMIVTLPAGKDVKFSSPPTTASEEFSDRQLRRAAAGLGITFEDLTGDYSKVNFSSGRLARLSHWANVRDWQFNMLIPSLCEGIWAWFVEAASQSPMVPELAATWTCPPMPMIEPDKEGLAYSRLVRNGVMTHFEAIREQGYDPDTFFAEYKAGLDKLDELGITLDSDPRAVSQAGQVQMTQGGAASAAPSEEDSSPAKTKDE
jgi:lambda family phage portal protein